MTENTDKITKGSRVEVLAADGGWFPMIAEDAPKMGRDFMVVWAYPEGRPMDAVPWPLTFQGEPAVKCR